MGIMQWIKNLFHKEEPAEPEEVISLTPEPAPEPVPERRTSDEMIEEMAESQVEKETPAPEQTEEELLRQPEEEIPDDTIDMDDLLYDEEGRVASEESTDSAVLDMEKE